MERIRREKLSAVWLDGIKRVMWEGVKLLRWWAIEEVTCIYIRVVTAIIGKPNSAETEQKIGFAVWHNDVFREGEGKGNKTAAAVCVLQLVTVCFLMDGRLWFVGALWAAYELLRVISFILLRYFFLAL